jgi:hypothetical protein
MAEKTIVDKAGETVGVEIAMAPDVADAVKTAIGAAVTTVAEVLSKAPAFAIGFVRSKDCLQYNVNSQLEVMSGSSLKVSHHAEYRSHRSQS